MLYSLANDATDRDIAVGLITSIHQKDSQKHERVAERLGQKWSATSTVASAYPSPSLAPDSAESTSRTAFGTCFSAKRPFTMLKGWGWSAQSETEAHCFELTQRPGWDP